MWQEMDHWMFLGRYPLTLVEVKIILWKAGSIDNTKIRTFHRCVILVVPWGWLTDIVGTGPDKLTCIAGMITVKGPRGGRCPTPTNPVIAVV